MNISASLLVPVPMACKGNERKQDAPAYPMLAMMLGTSLVQPSTPRVDRPEGMRWLVRGYCQSKTFFFIPSGP
jgi:hypothetical protein